MTFIEILLLFVAALFSGAINAVAGGGTFLTFGALTLIGVPPIAANATSSITQFPGYVTSTLAYRDDIKRFWREALLLAVVSAGGALLGAMALLTLDNISFRLMVPWLLLAATLLFAVGPRLKPKSTATPRPRANWAGPVIQTVTAVYGGFFGAGMGVMMLATLGLTGNADYHRLNAMKNLLSIIVAAVAIIIFVSGGVISWPHALAMIPGVALGGYAGVWLARRVPQPVLRALVITVGIGLSLYYFSAS